MEALPAAEAKKAEGASMTALLTPRPPEETGKEAWSQPESDRCMLHMDSNRDLWRSSNEERSWEPKHGAVRRTYRSLGREKAFLNKQRASWAWRALSLSPRISS
jgi:hypothetical protein